MEIISLPADQRPILVVAIHTEEEFDWGRPFDRRADSVAHMAHMDRAQDLFDRHGVRPTYEVDYPIATRPEGRRRLREYAADGRAEIGAHCHPWVSPPYGEALTRANSYPGNLPPELEAEKLRVLTEAIGEAFGQAPRSYLAGRYGFGPHTGGILADLGYRVDISPCVPLDFREDGGPDYSGYPADPFWFRAGGRTLLGLPGSGAYLGLLGRAGRRLYPLATRPLAVRARLPGVLSRLGLLDRLRLSPEGYALADLKRLTRALLARGQRVLVFSFHSPSVAPGYTPYVRSEAELRAFLETCDRYLGYVMGELGGVAMTALALADYLAARRPPGSGQPWAAGSAGSAESAGSAGLVHAGGAPAV